MQQRIEEMQQVVRSDKLGKVNPGFVILGIFYSAL